MSRHAHPASSLGAWPFWLRLAFARDGHDAAGTGPLGGPEGAQPRARRSFLTLFQDGIGHPRFTADFGTNGGTVLERPELPPPRSETVLVSQTRYAADSRADWREARRTARSAARRARPPRGGGSVNQPGSDIAPDGVVNQTKRNRLGEEIVQVEAVGTPAQRTVRFQRHASGQVQRLILENPDTGEQVTEMLFGSTLATSGVARNDVVVGKVYPTGESEQYTVNRQGEQRSLLDPNGSEREFRRDLLARLVSDAAVALGEGVDGAMRRVSTEFNQRGLPELFSTHDHPESGQGNVINQVKRLYGAFNEMLADLQEHDGEVNGSTPGVAYDYTDGSDNVLRLTAVTAPSGAKLLIDYGAPGSITDIFNVPVALKVDGEAENLVEYEYAGIARVVKLLYPKPGVELSYFKPPGEPGQSDAGDGMAGYDRFNRTVRMPWTRTGDEEVLADTGYGYDEASRRKWRQDLTPAAQAAFDRFFGYDDLGQIKSADRGTLNENRTAIGGIPKEAEAWLYDQQGNWEAYRKDEDGSVEIDQTREHNESNQVTTVDGSNAGVAYDKNGNMTRVPTGEALTGAPRLLKWSAWNQLVEVRNASNQLLQQNVYDALFRRVTRELGDSSVIHCYYNEKWRPIEERFGSSSDPSVVYFWGARHRDDLARRDRNTDANGTLDESLWCLMDYFDPVAAVDGEGEVVERYTFTAFGLASFLEPDYSPQGLSAVAWDFLFHGQFEDAETGWQNYGFRFYVPLLGRWPNRDPIGERGGSRLYGFAGNDGVNYADLFGLAQPHPPDPTPPTPTGRVWCAVKVVQNCKCEEGESCGEISATGTGHAWQDVSVAAVNAVRDANENLEEQNCGENNALCPCPTCQPDGYSYTQGEPDCWWSTTPHPEDPPAPPDPRDGIPMPEPGPLDPRGWSV